MVEFRMPSLGADMEAGTLVEWLVKPGDKVKRGDVIAVVETQKGAIEIEVFETGQIETFLVDLHAKVPVGTPLARIRTAGEGPPAPAPPPRPARAPPVAAPAARPVLAAAVPAGPGQPPQVPPPGIRASPAARRLAHERGVDLATVAGSGPGGAIVRADVQRAAAGAPPAAEKRRAVGVDLAAMRVAIAAAMARSKREIPHYYLEHQVDVNVCETWLAQTNAARPPDSRVLFGALAIKSVANALKRFPAFNGFFRDGKYEPSAAIHIGVAIAVRGGGLAAPAVHDVNRLTVDELMARLRDLVQRMRTGRIRSSEIADATVTVSSLGERGVDALYGVIYPPQVALVGFGKPVPRPWVIDGAIGPRTVVTLTLAADHRVSDGHAGALFLAEIGRLLQEPDKL